MRIGTKVTNPGEMTTQISLQSRTVSTDDGGFQSPSWTTVAAVWSRWENVHGAEVWTAQTVQADSPATVLIRYRSGVDTAYAVLKGSTRYEIVSVDDIGERHEYMELKVRRMRSG